MTSPALLVVVGLQKSGTSLLNRLLQRIQGLAPLGAGEADAFWGNRPPFSPTDEPVGRLRLARGDAFGHELESADASPEVVDLMRDRFEAARAEADARTIAFVNKNPYLTVRLPWLRAVFPEATVVAMVRRPEANVFSLTKKFVPHPGRGLPPEASGWWGVKPAGWTELLDPDPTTQCLGQWIATNERLLATLDARDTVIDYATLCDRPATVLRHVADRLGIGPDVEIDAPDDLDSRDEEFLTGSTLRSKNRLFRQTGDFRTPSNETAEHPPLDDARQRSIAGETGDLWSRILRRRWTPEAIGPREEPA